VPFVRVVFCDGWMRLARPHRADASGSRGDGYSLIGRGVGARAVGLAIATPAGLLTVILTVRLLPPSSYGALAFGLSTAVVFAGVGRLGLDPAVARSVALVAAEDSPAAQARIARGAFTLVGLTGTVGAAATLLVVELGTGELDQSTRLVLGISLGLVLYGSNVAAVAGALARGAGHPALMEVPNLASTLARVCVVGLLAAVGVAKLGWVAAGFGAAAVVGLASSGAVTRFVIGHGHARTARLGAARALLPDALPFAVTGLAAIVISRFDVLVLGLSATSAEVGRYEPSLRIVEQAMLLAPLLFTAQFLPVASRTVAAGNAPAFNELYVGISKLVVVVSFPLIVLLAAFPETLLHALYGSGFPASGLVVWLLLPGFAVNLALGLNSSALAAAGHRRRLARSGGVATATMTVVALVLIPLFGVTGAAAATSTTYVVFNVWVSAELWRATGVHPLRADFVLTVLTAATAVGTALAIRGPLAQSNLWAALGWSCAISAGWAILLLGARLVRRDELRRLVPIGR
jgi:O-antigen/teichoic acid export membrane protein